MFSDIEKRAVAGIALDVLLPAERATEIEARGAVGRIQVRRRPEEQAIDDAEHRRVGADAESEGGDDADREAGLEAKPAQRVAQILGEAAPPFRAPLLIDARAIDFRETPACALNVAEASLGFPPGFVGIHAAVHELPHSHLEVKAQLVVDGARDAGAAALDAHQSAESGYASHGRNLRRCGAP